MDILKAATDWAKAEVFSSMFFIFFAILMLLGSLGFYGIGKTAMAKAYVIPMLPYSWNAMSAFSFIPKISGGS